MALQAELMDTTVMARSSTLPEVLDSTNTDAGEVARGAGDREHVEGEGELRLVGG